MDWKACEKGGLVKGVKIDKNLVTSLIKGASRKLKTQALLGLDADTATSKVSLTYEALREILEAIALSQGYKIYNHECYAAFLREILGESALAGKFNDFRKIRNDVNYYGKDLNVEEAESVLKGMQSLIEAIKKRFIKVP
ncbi:hypothetical protein HY772_10030 [Candidatus Woesearchaeota archaeon]|nr:hypothetical protein [Candidatus Woesearchaeota archaeon]